MAKPPQKENEKRLVQQIQKTRLASAPEKKKPITLIPSGSALLNLACSDKVRGAFQPGHMINIIGDSNTGKSVLALSMLAEVAGRAEFDDYQLIYDDVEQACTSGLINMFGETLAKRIQSPAGDENLEKCSDTIQDFRYNILRAIDRKKPFIYVLDSFDAITTDEDLERIEMVKKARMKQRQAKEKGSFRLSKPKIMSEMLSEITRRVSQTKSFLVIISQTRDNINPMSFEKKVRSGGRALKFYCSHEIWLMYMGKIAKDGKSIGSRVLIKITKNKITGKRRAIQLSLYDGYGIDDVGSCVNFLVEEKFWPVIGPGKVHAPDFSYKSSETKLVRLIERHNQENQLRQCVQRSWNAIEDALKIDRKRRYT